MGNAKVSLRAVAQDNWVKLRFTELPFCRDPVAARRWLPGDIHNAGQRDCLLLAILSCTGQIIRRSKTSLVSYGSISGESPGRKLELAGADSAGFRWLWGNARNWQQSHRSLPSGAKALLIYDGFIGTTEVMPFHKAVLSR